MIGAIKKLITPSAVAGVDERLDEIRAQMQALAEAEASAQSAIDALGEELRSDLDAGLDTTEVEGNILSARRDLERLALRRGGLEKLASEKTRVLKEKRHRARVAALEQAEVAARAELATLDEETIGDLLRVSEKFSRRAKVEYDIFVVNARLQHLGGVPRGVGDLAWDEAPLVAEFLRRHQPEATRPLPFGEQPWGPFTLTLPTLTPDRTVAALVADDEAASA